MYNLSPNQDPMISFRFRSTTKKIKIKTNKKLDERMSHWLQKVFNLKNPIVGFKTIDNKYYDVETFYTIIEKFFGQQVDILENNDQVEISFTSDNLNSSSFIRPSQPNTSELNHKASSDSFDSYIFVNDKKLFEKKISENSKQFIIFFEIHQDHKRQITQNTSEFNNYSSKSTIFICINKTTPKKSTFSIYIGKLCVATLPLQSNYKSIIRNSLQKYRKNPSFQQKDPKIFRYQQGQEDEAPSFTTYHLQERLNQEACSDYLTKMFKERIINNYEYKKLMEKLEDNFIDFYRIFCEGVLDNDYDSFKHELKSKVENNLQILLNNVQEMDLSRPISREEHRRLGMNRKYTSEIQIVKVQNYFQVLDQLKDRIDSQVLSEVKQNLLDQNEELCSYFSKYLNRQYSLEELYHKISNFSRIGFEQHQRRYIPRQVSKSKSTDQYRQSEAFKTVDFQFGLNPMTKIEEAPMFGSASITPIQVHVHQAYSPIKHMSKDIQTSYKVAFEKLSKKCDHFAPEEYGLLYHFLQTRDDSISNVIMELEQNLSQKLLQTLQQILKNKIQVVMKENFNQNEIQFIQTIKKTPQISCIYENFKYECDISNFFAALKEEINRNKPLNEGALHKNSSDSQLLENKAARYTKRRYSDEQQQPGSPKISEGKTSVFLKNSEHEYINVKNIIHPWEEQFQRMILFCDFQEERKKQYLRQAFLEGNPSIYMLVREFLKNQETISPGIMRDLIKVKDFDQKELVKVIPFFQQLMHEFKYNGSITQKIHGWAVVSFIELSVPLLSALEVYLCTKNEEDFIENIKIIFQKQHTDVEFYKIYLQRIEKLLKQMSIQDQVSLEVFKYYPELIHSFSQIYYLTGDFDQLMQNLDILQSKHKENSILKVSSLNFSGINTNPFEYNDGSEMFVILNQTVKEITQKQFPGLTNWDIGKIDKVFQKNRLSVGFTSHIDLVQGKLPNRVEFQDLWTLKYASNGMNQKVQPTPSQQQINNCIAMDYIFYQAVVKYVYKLQNLQNFDVVVKQLQQKTVQTFLEQKFNCPSSRLDIKQDMVINYLLKQQIDILCLQEAGFINWKEELIKDYAVIKKHDSVIIFRKNKLGKVKLRFMEQYAEKLDFNNDSCILFTDKDYLVISGHLKSKSINRQQAENMFQALCQIKEEHPLLKIVVGIDANHFLSEQKLEIQGENGQVIEKKLFQIVPNVSTVPTSIKKRTFLQCQYKKSDLEVSEVKDHIFSTHDILNAVIQKINGQQTKNELLPYDVHPFDHFIVRGTINFL